jgi:hypothetical protein
VLQANGTAERDAALVTTEKLSGTRAVTVGGDKGFDTRGFVAECRNLRVTQYVAQNHAGWGKRHRRAQQAQKSMDRACVSFLTHRVLSILSGWNITLSGTQRTN